MRRNTKQFLITELLEAGKSRREAYTVLRPMVEAQQAPMIFQKNVNGRRIPKALSEQLRDLGYAINRIANSLNRYTDSEDFEFDNSSVVADEIPESAPVQEIGETKTQDEKKPVRKSATAKLEDSRRWYLNELRRIREFCKNRAVNGETVDKISNRPAKAGDRLLPAIPPEALLSAMTLHWPTETRRDAGIADFDFVSLSREIMQDRGITEIERADGSVDYPHEMFGYCLTLLEARQPVFAIGEAGTGKSYLANQLADFMKMEYSEAPMTPGATRGDLLGRHTIGGFVSAEFVERYSGGGLFNFEEIDAADPGMLIVLNNALESKTLFNSVSGEKHNKHSDACFWATGNTFGLGANREYTGREKLDAATLDRWRMGRVIIEIDPKIEEAILGL
jgi:AAA domain (dynein-related subfamily)